MSDQQSDLAPESSVQQERERPPQQSSSRRRWRPSRRGFLIGVGALTAGLALGIHFGLPEAQLRIAERLEKSQPRDAFPDDPALWFEVLPDNRVRLFLIKMEMGQGVHTALAQIAAEELAVAWEQLEVVAASTNQGPVDSMGTANSSSVSSLWGPLRRAGATLREMLRRQGAAQLGVTLAQTVAKDGGVEVVGDAGQRLTYGAIVAGVADPKAWQVPEEEPPLKPDGEMRFVGQSMPRLDLPAKVTGQARYGYDVRLEGMRYGAVARPPTLEGKLRSARPGSAPEMPGVEKVVIDGDFVGVVARSRAEAAAARNKLALAWDAGRLWQQEELEAMVTVGDSGGVSIQREGDAPGYLARTAPLVAEYRTPFAFHATLEPQAALADVQADRARVWVSTQGPHVLHKDIAAAIGLKPEQVEVIPTYLGGGFGRKIEATVAVEAARLSQASGLPVHVGWDRSEEMRHGFLRPPTHHRLRGALDENGRIVALEHQQASGEVAFGFLPGVAATVLGADFGAWRGATIQYDVPNRHVVTWVHKLPVPTGWWRGLGLLANIFALESFMDELAYAAGADPLAFRLSHLPNSFRGERMRATLEAVAELAGWGDPLPDDRARGVACSVDADTIVAQVAEVSLDEARGQVRVHRIHAAMDCGRVINPDGATAQLQGGIMMGVGSTLLEEARIEDGRIAAGNFDSYPLLTMREAPQIQTVLLEAGDGQPRGVGEPPVGPVAAAIANALFALTGQRVRRLPITPERLA